MPSVFAILAIVLYVLLMLMMAVLLPKKVAVIVECILLIAVLAYLFIFLSYGQAMVLLSFGATAYASFGLIIDRGKREKYLEVKRRLDDVDYIEMSMGKEMKRLAVDVILTGAVCSGAVLFLLFAPETYTVLKMFIGFMLITFFAKTVERVGNFSSSRVFWVPTEERLIILSQFQSRELPIQDLKQMSVESSPDLLKLHPLFTFLSSNQDYTSSFQRVLKLSFPGENIYLTPNEIETWQELFSEYVDHSNQQKENLVLPVWHPTVLKRLLLKGYFASTVKGISAYTGLLFLLLWIGAPTWAMILFVLLWWGVNIYFSDKVLIAASDAEAVTSGYLYERAQAIFAKAGVGGTKLYLVDSPIYNGFATGMNIGRGTVVLTSATLQLPNNAVDAILAHEAMHLKKRDILTIQLARFVYFGVLAASVYLFFDELQVLADHILLFTLLVYLIMFLFPIYLSFVSQWTEVRADYLGGELLAGGRKQMAEGLTALLNAQEQDLDKQFEYSVTLNNKSSMKKLRPNTNRDSWFWRFLEFQFQAHPPMYWRIMTLTKQGEWSKARKRWVINRFTESLPDFLRKNQNPQV